MIPDSEVLKNQQAIDYLLPNINSASPSSQSQLSVSSPESNTSSPCVRSSLPNSPNNNETKNSSSRDWNLQRWRSPSRPGLTSSTTSPSSSSSTPNNHVRQHCLPIDLVKNKILSNVNRHDTIILIGETGSGKTTRIPQFLYHYYCKNHSQRSVMNGVIGITQPRRVAAVSIGSRVAEEMGTTLGQLVGYKIRFEDCVSPQTKIQYMTDGILLRESLSNHTLDRYDFIILDEAHERTVQSDMLFGIVKRAQKSRKRSSMKRTLDGNESPSHNTLKLIIMSATMDVDHLSKYFDSAPVLYVEGRIYPIEIFYAESKHEDYTDAALTTIFQIHRDEDELDSNDSQMQNTSIGGDILVFCTGQEEIESMVKIVQDLAPQTSGMKSCRGNLKTLKPYPLYSALPTMKQQQIFTRDPNDCFRRVIFATNIAETSITIPNIRFVIDTGRAKSKSFSPKTGFEILKIERISKAQSCQRSGRAGRLAPGKCFRLLTRAEYRLLPTFPIPEIQKCSLSNVILQLIAAGISDPERFDFIDRPSADSIKHSISKLILMNAIEKIPNESNENDDSSSLSFRLTEIGKKMIVFPIEPEFALMIIMSQKYRCTEEIITIISMLSIDNVFYVPNSERDVALAVHKKFASSEGDLVKLLKVFREYKESRQALAWCQDNFLRPVQMRNAFKIRQQLLSYCNKISIPIISSSNTENIRKCFALGSGLGIGLGANIALLQNEGGYRIVSFQNQTKNDKNNDCLEIKTLHIHPSSCLFSPTNKPECVFFIELVQTTKLYMRNVSIISKEWLTT
ncbi:ATP-dependent RNA helicase DHX33 [Sarcoptes scabiei]|uniref:RNA helicase n=1 Tax=Sarcoptes scabiei TaxID=52283 RepID=A0A834R6S2_SARSC|nr:ATP-dependent RNA helicase DHX33 [Sarcoptes scabiei]